jgi:hypothetical protein
VDLQPVAVRIVGVERLGNTVIDRRDVDAALAEPLVRPSEGGGTVDLPGRAVAPVCTAD